tara:strand:+ start:665 stop:928 length:264 start_codon:yes stop_codon:yes gene_type:complete
MPSKFITAGAWKAIERLTVDCVTELQVPIKDTEMLNYVIIKGIANLKVADIRAAQLLHEVEEEESITLEKAQTTLERIVKKQQEKGA